MRGLLFTVGLTLTAKFLFKESRLRLLGSRHFPGGGSWLSWRLGAFLLCSSSMIAQIGSKKNTKKPYKCYKNSSFFCKKCEVCLCPYVGCIGGFLMVQVLGCIVQVLGKALLWACNIRGSRHWV